MSRSALPREVRRALGALERRLFRVLFTYGLGRVAWKGCASLFGVFLLDRFFDPPVYARLALVAGALAFWLSQTYADLIVPMRRRPGARDLAAWWERCVPELGDLLATATEQADAAGPPSGSVDFRREVDLRAEAAARRLRPREAVPSGRARRSLLAGAGAASALLALAALRPDQAWIFARRLIGQDLPWPSDTRLVLLPLYVEGTEDPVLLEQVGSETFRVALARGSAATVRVRAEGKLPERVTVSGLGSGERAMVHGGAGEFLLHLPAAESEAALAFRGGDDTDGRPVLRIEIGDAPGVQDWLVRALPPEYSGRPAEQSAGFEWRVLRGTRLIAQFATDRPVERVIAERLDGSPVAVIARAEGGFRFEVEADRSDQVALTLVGTDGFLRRRAAILRWEAEADRPPQVRILFPSVRWTTVPGAEVPLAVEVQEDFGLVAVTLTDFARQEIPLVPDTVTALRRVFRLTVAPAASAEGFAEERVQAEVRAQDAALPDPQTARALTPWIEVVAPAVFDQRQAERIVRTREQVAALRDRLALAIESPETLNSSFARRARREIEALVGEVELELLTRLWSGLDEGTGAHAAALESALLTARPAAGAWMDALAVSGLPKPYARSGLLADLGDALLATRRGPARDLEEAGTADRDPLPSARALLAELDRILEILTIWEDYQSAVNLLRDLIQRQREIHLRTREASGR